MARTGKALLLLAATLLPSLAAAAEVEFYMTADRTRIGVEDTFTVQVIVSGAPEGALVELPQSDEFETLSRSESDQVSLAMTPGNNAVVRRVRKYSLVMRANRPGTLKLPPAKLRISNDIQRTQPVILEVVKGRLEPDRPPQNARRPIDLFNPFQNLPGFPDLADPFEDQEQAAPAGENDLFVRAEFNKKECVVGEQVTYSVSVLSRMDLMQVNNISMPKFDGFWSSDLKTSNQLAPEQVLVGGVPYRRYLLREKALFAMKPGEAAIESASVEMMTGFLLNGHALSRKSNELKLVVKPLPTAETTNVGSWRLSAEVNQTQVALGEPIQLRVIAEGKGNLQALEMPVPQVPAGFRLFDPQVQDRPQVGNGRAGGSRSVEYVMLPQKTGTFTLPGLLLKAYDPESKRVTESRTDDLVFVITPATGSAPLQLPSAPTATTPETPSAKNQLDSGGLRPLRQTAHFSEEKPALWARPFFAPLAAAPVVLGGLALLVGLILRRFKHESADDRVRKQAKAARKRLAAAEELLKGGSTADFYAEVEKALVAFLDAKLGGGVAGLTRAQLETHMAHLDATVRARVVAVLETCEAGRYAPGMGQTDMRRRALEEAAKTMEAWP